MAGPVATDLAWGDRNCSSWSPALTQASPVKVGVPACVPSLHGMGGAWRGLRAFSWASWPDHMESLTQTLSWGWVEGPIWTVPLSQPGGGLVTR